MNVGIKVYRSSPVRNFNGPFPLVSYDGLLLLHLKYLHSQFRHFATC
jgi:hypothetical protein